MKTFAICLSFLGFALFVSPVLNQIEVVQEAEMGYTYAGPGSPSIKPRSNASNQQTLWVNQVGGEASWEIIIPATGDYSLVVRYSNDDTGVLDDISVRVNGSQVGGFESEDTGSGGSGWNVFVESPAIPLGQLAAGTVTLSLRLDAHDGFGIEYDLLTLTGTNIQPPPTPLLVSPANGTSNISANPLLDWNPSPGVNTYHVQIDDSPDFSSPEVDAAGLTDTEYQAGNLAEGTAFYWRVRASNACEDSPWTASWTFTTECLVSANISASGPTTFCNGEIVQLTATGGNEFLWSNGATTASITVASTGTYSVTVSNSINCTASDTIAVTVQPVVTPTISIEVDNSTICGGNAITFEATAANGGNQPAYQWLVNGDDAGTNSPVFTTNALDDGDMVQCRLLSSEDCPGNNPVFSNTVTVSKTQAYYHPLQNFDFYVDRVKSFYNFFGGNSGVVNADLLELAYDTSETRTGYGRSLKITYEDMENFSIYVESLERKWFDGSTWLNLKNLFPDFTNPALQNRQIDSIVFYGKLVANQPLTLQVKLEDANHDGATINQVVQPSSQWQRFAFSLDDFTGNFNPEIAKFVGLNFDQGLGNAGTSGVFYLDDMYLVESCFEKPSFSSPEEMMAYLNEVSFRYFWMAVEPKSKFTLDRHVWDDLISTDAIGFSLAAHIVAHKNGWIDPVLIEDRVEHILTYLLDSCAHATDTNMVVNDPLGYASVNGIWAHFLDHNTLARKDDRTEFSIFSSALLLAGVITAGEYFDSNPNIVSKADSLYRMTDWNFLLRPDGLMNYDWKPETGFSPYYTDWFSEELDLAFLLGISSPEPTNSLLSNPYFLDGYRKPHCIDGDYIYSAPGSNFTYYFLQMYARFDEQTQRFQNSRNALLTDLAFCQNEYGILGYDPLIFGTTACEGPDSAGIDFIVGTDTFFISNYHAYGYCCKFDQHNTGNGTVAVYGSGSAALFLPQEVKDLWEYYYNDLDEQFWDDCGYRFWSPIFGMPDAFHLAPDSTWDTLVNGLGFRGPWLSAPRFGIDVGPMLMNMDSYLSEMAGNPSVRDYFSSYPSIASNLSQFENIAPTDELKAGVSVHLISPQTVCEGEPLIFEAAWEHGGDDPIFEWYLDVALEQSGTDTIFSVMATPGNHQIFCRMISSEHCIEGQMATSSSLSANVLPASPVSVMVMASSAASCVGDEITLTAIVANGGTSPFYQWMVNGVDAGVNEPVLVLNEQGGKDTVTCVVTSSVVCAANNPATSSVTILEFHALPVIMFQNVNSYCLEDEPSELTIALPSGGMYLGNGIIGNVFDPALAGEGTHPVTYIYTDPATGCTNAADTALLVAEALTASVDILTSADEICEGDAVVFTAVPTNGGDSPTIEWLVNGLATGTTGQVFETDSLEDGDAVTCKMTSSGDCVNEPMVMSVPITVTVFLVPNATANNTGPSCEDGVVILSADGGSGYQWEGPNGFSSNEDTVVLEQVTTLDAGTYTVAVTNSDGCTGTASTTVVVNPQPTIDSIYSNAPLCSGDTLEISASTDGISYVWTAPDDDVYNQQTVVVPDASVFDSGIWVLSVNSMEGCEAEEGLGVVVNGLPSVSINPDCLPDSILAGMLPFPLDSCGIPYGGIFSVNGEITDTISPQMMVGVFEIVYSYPDTNGCTGTAVALVDIVSESNTVRNNGFHVKIFPNPSDGLFNVALEGLRGSIQVSLYDPYGREVERQVLNPGELDGRIFDLRHLPSGVYFFVLEQGVNRWAGKVVILG